MRRPLKRVSLPILAIVSLIVAAQPTVAQSVSCILAAACPGATHEGGGVAIHVRCSTATGVFQSLDLLSLKRDGIVAAPAMSPVLIGLDSISVPAAEELIFFW